MDRFELLLGVVESCLVVLEDSKEKFDFLIWFQIDKMLDEVFRYFLVLCLLLCPKQLLSIFLHEPLYALAVQLGVIHNFTSFTFIREVGQELGPGDLRLCLVVEL